MSISDNRLDADPADEPAPGLDMEGEPTAACAPRAPFILGAVIVAIGAVLLWQAWKVPGDLAPQGPRFLPVAIAVLWILLGIAYLAGAVVALIGRRPQTAGERLDHLPRVLALIVVLIAYAYAIDPLGYLISTAVLFAACAALLGSRNHIRDVIIAVGLTVAIYFLFSRGLNIYLPPGPLPL